ncbi:hypothetical protein CLOM_g8930 [Closterium sp. NIES-68]|nr:hypothetical protein CLOM_g8930 [Closterium sp. NIES-68]
MGSEAGWLIARIGTGEREVEAEREKGGEGREVQEKVEGQWTNNSRGGTSSGGGTKNRRGGTKNRRGGTKNRRGGTSSREGSREREGGGGGGAWHGMRG